MTRKTREAKALCNAIVDDPEYQQSLRARMIAGTAGAIESVVWYFAKGKPTEHIEVTGFDPVAYLARSDEAPS